MAKEKSKKAAKTSKKPKKKEKKKKPAAAAEKEKVVKAPEPVEEVKEEAKEEVIAAEAPKPEPAPEPAPAPKPRISSDEVAYTGTGRRKTSTARVRLVPGTGKITVNDRSLTQHLHGRRSLEIMVRKPLELTGTSGKYDVAITVEGGGSTGQAGAMAHGISRALLEVSPDFRIKLKPEKLLSRDPRMKERKKYGRKKARKRFQYSKR